MKEESKFGFERQESVKSDNSSAGSNDSDESPTRPDKNSIPLITDDDEEYSNMYRKAKKAHHQKLIQKSGSQDKERNSLNAEVSSSSSEDEDKEFYHYLAVPVLEKQSDREENSNSDEESITYKPKAKASFIKYEDTTVSNREYEPAINYKKSYLSMSGIGTSIMNQNQSDSDSSEEEQRGKKHKKLKKLTEKTILLDSHIQKESIGETLFESTNLKGYQKSVFFYMFIVACLRFVCFRGKKPIRRIVILIFPFILLLVLDVLITFNLILHMKTETSNENTFSGIGLWYFFLYPGVAVLSPIVGLISQIV